MALKSRLGTKAAMTAAAPKLARILWAMVKHRRPYDPSRLGNPELARARKEQPPFSPLDTPNLRYPRPFRQKQISSSPPPGRARGKSSIKLGEGHQFHKSQWHERQRASDNREHPPAQCLG